jgi:hypothetical protein
MSRDLKTFVYSSVAFSIPMAVVFSLQFGAQYGVTAGLTSGILFGATVTGFVMYQAKKFTTNRPRDPGETLLHEGGANRLVTGEAVGGWMYMTDRRLLFVSHAINVQSHTHSIPAEKIARAIKANALGIIPNQLLITLTDGSTEKFVVYGATEWAAMIGDRFIAARSGGT